LIPLTPQVATTNAATSGDNNVGDAIAINGVPLAKADPLTALSS